MDLKLNEKVALVTGGAKGIGEAVCRTLHTEGATVCFIDIDVASGQKLAEDLGSRIQFIETDLLDVQACADAVASVISTYGRLDVVINNAGFNDAVGLSRSVDDFVASLRLNLVHVFAITSAAIEALKASRGAIVNLGSKVAETGQGGTSGYAAAKGAIHALTREWALDLADSGVRANAVLPAECLTDMYTEWVKSHPDGPAHVQRASHAIPLGRRMTTTQELANAVVFLASDCASHITGQLIHVDGGYTHLDRVATIDL
jgi:L-fucose dehydrogenase